MPKQSLLTLIKRCRFYETKDSFDPIPKLTRGIYVLYRDQSTKSGTKTFEVTYIGVGGVAEDAKRGIVSRLQSHRREKKNWTHYSVYEVHDNVSNAQILELEGLLLRIFKHDPRIKLDNRQFGIKRLKQLSLPSNWP